jgi:hypothetical protein
MELNMSESIRWKENRVRLEIYKELLKRAEPSPNPVSAVETPQLARKTPEKP